MREGEKKTFEKKTVNEGDQIKKTSHIFLEKLMRATK